MEKDLDKIEEIYIPMNKRGINLNVA